MEQFLQGRALVKVKTFHSYVLGAFKVKVVHW
jgi:hypothetical protein